jgi:hypothetical protein
VPDSPTAVDSAANEVTDVAVDSDAELEGGVSEGAQDSSNAETETEHDPEALRAQLEEVRRNALSRAEFDDVKRQVGHIKALQRTIADLQKRPTTDSRVDILISALADMLPDDARAQLVPDPIRAELNELKAKIAGDPEESTDDQTEGVTPEIAATVAMWEAVEAQVVEYAKTKNIDPYKDIPQAVFQGLVNQHAKDPATGMAAIFKEIDTRVEKRRRIAEKADAASGGVTNRSAGRSTLTWEAAQNMTAEQLMEYPKEERDRVLASRG